MKKITRTFILSVVFSLLVSVTGFAEVLANQPAGTIVDFSFTSRNTSAVPTSIIGGAIACIKGNSGATSTAGVTFTADLGSVTALNHLRVDLSADTAFYAVTSDIACYFTSGTVAGTSIVPEIVIQFTISNVYTVQYGVAFPNYPFYMQSTNATPKPGIVVTCRIAKDAGGFNPINSAVTEVSDGLYRINLTAAEMTAKVWELLCTGPGAMATRINTTNQQ